MGPGSQKYIENYAVEGAGKTDQTIINTKQIILVQGTKEPTTRFMDSGDVAKQQSDQ